MTTYFQAWFFLAGALISSASTVQYKGDIAFADPNLVLGTYDRGYRQYPDDYNLGLENPNIHATRINQEIDLHDAASAESVAQPSFSLNGFEFIQLDDLTISCYEQVFEDIKRDNTLIPENAVILRNCLSRRWLRLSDGSWLYTVHVADQGIAARVIGPGREELGENETKWNAMVHGDQQIDGFPLNNLLHGLSWLLFHQQYSPLKLINIWIPVQPIRSQPLVLMDHETLNPNDQLRYHIYNTGKAPLAHQTRLNDCWTYLHNASQKWWWRSEFNQTVAVIFSTLYSPHTSATLEGEIIVASIWKSLKLLSSVIIQGSTKESFGCANVTNQIQEISKSIHHANLAAISTLAPPIRKAFKDLINAHQEVTDLCMYSKHDTEKLLFLATNIEKTVQAQARKSVEMRAVGIVFSVATATTVAMPLFPLILWILARRR